MKKLCLLIFLFATPLCAMQGSPLDKSLMALNEILNQLGTLLKGRSVVIAIPITQERLDAIRDETKENFSSVIDQLLGDIPEAEGEVEILLPDINDPRSQNPFDDKTKTELFNYLADWQTTKSKLNTFNDDRILNMIAVANALQMEKVIDVLSNEFARRQKTALYADPQNWWTSIGKNLSVALPVDLQFKLSEQLLFTKEFLSFIVNKSEIPVPQLPGSLYKLWLRPVKELNVSLFLTDRNERVGMLYKDTQEKLTIKTIDDFYLYQAGNEFALMTYPDKKMTINKLLGWSPNGNYLFAVYNIPPVEHLRLLSWNDQQEKWQPIDFAKAEAQAPLGWSPDSTLLVTQDRLREKKIIVYFEKEPLWVEAAYPFKGELNGVSFSGDSKYLAIYSSEGLAILERDVRGGNIFNSIFDYAYDPKNQIQSLKWNPFDNNTFVVQTALAEVELWQKKTNEKKWEFKQKIDDIKTQMGFKDNFVTWSPQGTYLALANRGMDKIEKIQLFTNKNDHWVKSDELNVIASSDPQEEKKERVQDERIIEVNDVLWSNNEKYLLSVISAYTMFGYTGREFAKILTYAKLWVKINNEWQEIVITAPLLGPWISWDLSGDYFAAVAKKERGEFASKLYIWDLSILESLQYLTLQQTVMLIDWLKNPGEWARFSLKERIPKELLEAFVELPERLQKIIRPAYWVKTTLGY